MSISSEITRISKNVSDSLDAVALKGVTVPSGSTSDDLPDLIAQISGGSGGIVITDTTDSAGGTIRTIMAVDLSSDTVTAGSMLSGVTAHDNTGTAVTGNIVTKTGSDLSASGDTVTVPAGYYASQTTKAVASGTEGTPTATKGTVSNHSVTVTPSVTNTAGYISGGTINGTAVTVTASELESGTLEITENGTGIDVTGYASVDVAVSGGGGTTWETVFNNTVAVTTSEDDYYLQTITFGYTIDQNSVWKITWNGTPYECTATSVGITDFPPYAIGNDTIIHLQGGNNEPFYLQKIDAATLVVISSTSQTVSLKIEKQVSGGGATLITKTITTNGTYDAEDDDADGYSQVTVNVSSSSKNVQTAQTTDRRNNTSLGSIISLTCSTTGTYDVYWTCARSNTSQTWGSQLYIGGSSYGTENTTWSNNVQNNHLENVSISANQTVAVYGRSRSGYYIYAPQLTIVQK